MPDRRATSRHKLEWVQALRGIAALMVVLTHARLYLYGTDWDGFARRFMLPAAQGVDLFFLVSGFIMVYTTARSDGSAHYTTDFLIKRFARIWPVYAVWVLINWALQGLWASGPIPTLQNVVTSLAFLPINTDIPPYLGLPLSIGWTLNFEFYFYLVFGLSLLAGRFRWLAFFGWMLATLVLLPLAVTGTWSMHAEHDYGIGIAYIDQNVNPIIWDFVAGVAIGLLYVSRVRVASKALLAIIAACAIALACEWSFNAPAIETFHGMARWGLPWSILFAAMALAFKDREPRVPRALVWLGGISYSLYLAHLIVFETVDRLLESLNLEPFTHTTMFVLLVVPIPLIYAAISRRFLEDGLAVFVRRQLLRLTRPRNAAAVTSLPADG
jgi:peptidoglycan/LPS O-acetylase OafA/YrhL